MERTINEVFQNLITNAIKYNNKPEGVIKIKFEDLGTSYKFTIEDNGIGIDEQFHEKIFAVFQTLESKDKQESTGIGLTIVKKIIEQQKGKIWLESKIKEGTSFYFTWNK